MMVDLAFGLNYSFNFLKKSTPKSSGSNKFKGEEAQSKNLISDKK